MSTRAMDPRLKKLYDSGVNVYSISRLDCINRCLYEAYLTYIEKTRQSKNVYSILGSRIHDILERITNGTATEADLLPAMESEFEDLDMLNIEFPKTSDGRDTIRSNWIADMKHFCETYKAPEHPRLITEELFLYQSPEGHYLQGYIDLYKIRKDGSIDIYDYKTSTLYTGSEIKEHARQLILYALAKQQEGYKVNSVSWIFLKYATVKFTGKKTARSKSESEIVKNVERRKIAQELAAYVESDLLNYGLDEVDVEIKMDEFRKTNHFPVEVADKYEIKPLVLSVDLSEEAIQDCVEYVDSTIDKWEALSGYEEDYPPRPFTKIQKSGKEVGDYFFCTSLCGHFKHCSHIKEFLDKQSQAIQGEVSDDDLF